MEKFSDLFPTVTSLIIFVCYMVFCVCQGIFVTASHTKGENYAYNTVAVVLLTEITKLIFAFLYYIKDNTLSSLWDGIKSNTKILCLYLVPSFLYCIYNNMAFINLSHFDPTSYFILLQLRVVITGIIFQLVFNKKLTKIQWMSLVLLTCGCMIQQLDWDHLKAVFFFTEQPPSKEYAFFSIYLLFIFLQAFAAIVFSNFFTYCLAIGLIDGFDIISGVLPTCRTGIFSHRRLNEMQTERKDQIGRTLCSCFAGVYNEHLLKESGANINIFIQNIFMYTDSILWNLIVLSFQGNLLSTFSIETLQPIFQPLVIAIILNNSLVGLTTSLFLKNLNSILKTFASAMELLFTAVLSWIIFGIEIKTNTLLAIFIVSYSLYVYSQNPVSNRGKAELERTKNKYEMSLLQEV